jgi:hypothetical protein
VGAALVALSAAAALAACGSSAGQSTTTGGAIPGNLVREARPIGRGPRFQPPANGPVIAPCRRPPGDRHGVHIEVFASNRVVIVPAGIGTQPPRRYSAGRISAARCYGALVTLEPTGVALLRPGARLTLADLFRSWGQPLSSRRVASFRAPPGRPVAVFVGGRRWLGTPGTVPLRTHAEIVVEVGPHVPPHTSYTFPPGT